GGNFSALNTVLEGTAGRNNVGAKLAGNINVTKGNLSVTGTANQFSKGNFTGLLAQSGLNVNVSAGNLSLTGKVEKYEGKEGLSGSTGLNLTGATLSANNASLTGSNVFSGQGFVLNNVNLNGNIARGNNMTLSSCGSAAAVTNTLYVNGGLGWQAFKKFQTTGIDNNTAVIVTPDATDLADMNFTASGDWNFDASTAGAAAADKKGTWGLTFNNVTATTKGDITLTGMNMTNSNLTGSNVSLLGTANGSLTVTNSNLNATGGNISLSTTNNTLTVNNNNLTAASGNVSMMVTGVEGNANALTVSGGNITAGHNITLNGTVNNQGNGAGVYLSNTNMTAANNISVNGTGYDASNGGLNVNGGTFSAQNTVLEGTAQRNNVGAKLAGNINVTKGNLAVTGTMQHFSSSGFTGLLAQSGLNVNVSAGDLSLTGKTVAFPGGSAQSGNTVALNLTGATLSANHAHLTGSNVFSGQGFVLSNVTLSGNIARGNNMTLSSAGSNATVTNALYVNGGLGYQAFQKLQKAGIDNNTAVIVTPDKNDLTSMGLNATTGWTFDASTVGAAAADKAGTWGLTFNNINATTTGNITLTGMSMTNSNLTGSNVSLLGATNGSLTVTNSSLNATSGNISLSTTNGTLTVGNVNLTSHGNGTTLCGTSSLDNGTGVNLSGKVNVTQGNLTVNGTNLVGKGNVVGVNASGATLNVSTGNLAVTGNVASGVGINLNGKSVLNATTANLTGVAQSGNGFLLNATLQGGLLTNGSLTLNSTGSGQDVTNQIGTGVNSTIVKYMVENANTQHIGSYTDIAQVNLYQQSDINGWASNNQISKDFGDFGLHFKDINVSAGSINLSGANFVNSSLNATSGNLTIDNKAGSLGLANTSLNASAGNITLTGNAGISLSGNSTVTARNNITLNASAGGVSIVGTSNTTTVNITSNNGSISIDGNGSGRNLNGVEINNANLSATTGEINVTGVSDGISYYGNAGNGIALKNDVIFTSTKNTLTGRYNNLVSDTGSYTGAISVGAAGLANITFVGNTAIEATSKYAAGLLFNPMYGPSALLTFKGGNYTISGKTTENGAINATNSAGIANQAWNNKPVQPEFRVENGTLNISASGNDVDGMASFRPNAVDSPDDGARGSGYKFSGAGNVNINATSVSGNGINLRDFDNTGMTGTLTITGSSQSGSGVTVPEWGNVSLVNTTITGSSQTGTGILMNAGDSHSKKIDLNGNTLNGTSASGTGININGNNVSVANGSLTGTSQGSG
ncbi:S-layer family protein, partial [Salmonella enterica]|nr:S-layer family protein [Salmonella enterica]